MDKVAMVKKEVQLQNWSETELARQELCMPPQKPHVHGLLTAPCRSIDRTFKHPI